MKKKLGIAVMYLVVAILIYFYGESILSWMRHSGKDSVVITSIVATLLALFPIIPYPVIGGIIGAAYGPVLGAVVTWIGSALASILMFMFVRFGYQDWGMKVLSSNKGLNKITILFEKNAFLTIFTTRLIPVIPSILVNVYSALSRVHFIPYSIASSLGKVPSMILFATVGSTIATNPKELIYIILFYGTFLAIVYISYKLWRKRVLSKVKIKTPY
ncbi:TVP38/TMEM64 family protein [Bacillus sp. FJAT-45350]|uniref:TVP38/TMEM64 family protein n=1 Tax=Bacillus sp. FJAT-45350 TaxID=2011014 RepID=UPI000BB96313|nr:TVP38/TMEM64 family protein [Bacillus sp. FJAT-45350]